jgi:hypothetical protein
VLFGDHVVGPFLFVESSINRNIYQIMLENYFSPQTEDLEGGGGGGGGGERERTWESGYFHAGLSTSSFLPVCMQSLE